MKITKQRLKEIIKEELQLHENRENQDIAVSDALLKDLIKEELGMSTSDVNPIRAVGDKFIELKRDWIRNVKPMLESNINQSCSLATRHRRKALDLTIEARKLGDGAKRLVKRIRAHRNDVKASMKAAGCSSY